MSETSEYEISDEECLKFILETTEAAFNEQERKTNNINLTNKDVVNKRENPNLQEESIQATLFGKVIPKKPKDSLVKTIEEVPTHHEIDKESIKTWIYPTNMKERDYQFNIVQKALYQNILVSLPTGLGKTFIAAVVMFNYYRWFPKSKIIFVAPTKPLVSQQIQACYNICGIPPEDTIELSGNVKQTIRSFAWKEKRVFFMTPQALQNDLEAKICNKKSIVCLVIDEAHRAIGNYAYCNVVRMIRSKNKSFRILALTATPGTDIDSVQEVINSLYISHIELRTEDSIDIQKYLHNRTLETILVPLSQELITVRDLYGNIIKPFLQQLNSINAYHVHDPGELTTFSLIQAQKSFMKTPSMINAPSNKKGEFFTLFSFLSSLAYPMSLLICHGLNPFYKKLKELVDGPTLKKHRKCLESDEKFRQIISLIEKLRSMPTYIGHPKLEKLRSLVLNHFVNANDKNEETQAMIFVEYRSSAEDIMKVLEEHYPLVKAELFIGQSSSKLSSGMTQKEQISIIEKFKAKNFNTLIATSIGEEGLDIGEVDLIICYDSSSSSTRLLQRMGRTGRKRQGHIYILLTSGREERNYFRARDSYKAIQRVITHGNILKLHEKMSPRIIPKFENPKCHKQELIIDKSIISSDMSNEFIKKYQSKHQKKKTVLTCKNQFITASTLHKQMAEDDKESNETVNTVSSYDFIEHSNSEQKEYFDHDIKTIENQPLLSKDIALFPVSVPKDKLSSVCYVSHSKLCQRLIQTMQKINSIKTCKTVLDNFINNNRINSFNFRNILVKRTRNYGLLGKNINQSQCLKLNDFSKQESLKSNGLKEIQKEYLVTNNSLLSNSETEPTYSNKFKRRKI
ncbi:hypothetical protein PNEG_00451 [Pneumocystis murina B123]|uniref:ATP-dependent DNA helicase n=1 Tax=Pneumocystis murina (strain B123) TaxID=1069680 RepID=M7PC17_PNEMU|nr:hypothetical protein PNEG_00451 [Pneumocystis murina B123]EMR11430.1 hypothetical protein PNEG_00451 [Pneumocystis murina B123]